jgi:glycosyltransferase involved in cell wall biosynthesis
MTTPRALIVAYNFPPHGAVGTLRALRLVRQLDAEGWDVVVLAGAPATYLTGDPIEPGLAAQVPPGVRVVHARAVRPLVAAVSTLRGRRPASPAPRAEPDAGPTRTARAGWIRRVVRLVDIVTSIPDQECGWLVPAVLRGVALGRTWRPDVILSTAPPWTAQVVGWALSGLLRRPWVADFRDPWARAPWRENAPWVQSRATEWLERRVVRRAQRILVTTPGIGTELSRCYGPAVQAKIEAVPNGYDGDELSRLRPPRAAADPFVLLHAGTLYGGRNPASLFRAVASAVRRGALSADRFRLRLVGGASIAGLDLNACARELGLAEVVECRPRASRDDVLQQMRSASALLLLQPGHPLSIPAKAYEYLAAGRPILAVADEGETARLIERSSAGVVAPSADETAIERALLLVVEMARGPFQPASLVHYDGRMRAAEMSAVLGAMLRVERGRPAAVPRPDPPLDVESDRHAS